MQAADVILSVETTSILREYESPAEQIEITTDISEISETTSMTVSDPLIIEGLQSINNTQNNILTFMCVTTAILVLYKILGWFFNDK